MQNLFDLTGKTALVTGASSGLGEQFAKCLSQAGARVILVARRKDKLTALAKELQNAYPLELDISNLKSVQAGFRELELNNEKIDICINSAGIAKLTPIFEAIENQENDDFEKVIQTNIMGVWYVIKAAANHMKNFGIHGSIINISSVNGANFQRARITAYSASKASVIQMTKALVGELSPYHIRINAILPGLFHTPMTDHKLNTTELKNEMKRTIPLGFVASPSDLDAAILYLSSNKASSYVSGSCITVDGGISWGG